LGSKSGKKRGPKIGYPEKGVQKRVLEKELLDKKEGFQICTFSFFSL
jgi:hypothetical protein